MTELGTTPGVYVCAFCALWAARRTHPFRPLPRPSALPRPGRSLLRLARGPRPGETARLTVPILPSADQDRTVASASVVVGDLDRGAVPEPDPVHQHRAAADVLPLLRPPI